MQKFQIPDYIKKLSTKKIKYNLFSYQYDVRKLKEYFSNPTEELEHLYSSFKGELYENIIYENLLYYAYKNPKIKKFILKGPHQKRDRNKNKSGLLIDRKNQIVYKAAYKDISEFDALFFTDSEVYFVEMSTSKKTASLNKRLFKKQALLKVLFPSYEVKALIILTNGSVGLKSFPEYATIWTTDDFNDDDLLKEIINTRGKRFKLNSFKSDKLVEAYDIKHSNFKYYQTLKWILYQARGNKKFTVDLSFFNTQDLNLYFDIYSKLYIGFLEYEDFKTIFPDFEKEVIDNIVIVTIEKINQKKYSIVYYPKEIGNNLKRVLIDDKNQVNIKPKEKEGFTNAEVKFMLNTLKSQHKLTINDIEHINKNIGIITK